MTPPLPTPETRLPPTTFPNRVVFRSASIISRPLLAAAKSLGRGSWFGPGARARLRWRFGAEYLTMVSGGLFPGCVCVGKRYAEGVGEAHEGVDCVRLV